MLISSRRTGRMPSDVRKRCLPSKAGAGPESLRGQNQAGRPWGTDSNPHGNDLNPHGAVNGRGAACCKRIASPVHWTGLRRPRRSQELQSREVIDHMVVNRANARRCRHAFLCADRHVHSWSGLAVALRGELLGLSLIPGRACSPSRPDRIPAGRHGRAVRSRTRETPIRYQPVPRSGCLPAWRKTPHGGPMLVAATGAG